MVKVYPKVSQNQVLRLSVGPEIMNEKIIEAYPARRALDSSGFKKTYGDVLSHSGVVLTTKRGPVLVEYMGDSHVYISFCKDFKKGEKVFKQKKYLFILDKMTGQHPIEEGSESMEDSFTSSTGHLTVPDSYFVVPSKHSHKKSRSNSSSHISKPILPIPPSSNSHKVKNNEERKEKPRSITRTRSDENLKSYSYESDGEDESSECYKPTKQQRRNSLCTLKANSPQARPRLHPPHHSTRTQSLTSNVPLQESSTSRDNSSGQMILDVTVREFADKMCQLMSDKKYNLFNHNCHDARIETMRYFGMISGDRYHHKKHGSIALRFFQDIHRKYESLPKIYEENSEK